MSHLTAFATDDLKLIYRTLHSSLMENLELMDSGFFSELQSWLQTLAKLEDVDVSDHAQWDAWLQLNHTPCEKRLSKRRQLEG